MLKPTKILVPSDFSENADRALAQGLDIARHYGAKVFLLHVIPEDVYRSGLEHIFLDEQARLDVRERATNWAKENLQRQLGNFPQFGEIDVTVHVRWGVPYDEILKEEADEGIDLIVIASLGQSDLSKYLMGSVARIVLKGSKCPVLLTK